MTIFEAKESLRMHGRVPFRTDGSASLWWSFSGFSFRFCGDAFTVCTEPFVDEQPVHLAVIIDGITYKREATETETEHTFTLKNGEHTVEVRRASNRSGSPAVRITDLAVQGELLPPPPEKPMKMEFVGDSITCGYGVLGAPGSKYLTKEEDCTVNYAALTAAHFNAEARYESISGKGIVRNCGGDAENLIPQFFMRKGKTTTSRPWLFDDGFAPDVLVVNAGTNDVGGGTTPEDMTTAAILFIKDIRTRYPHTKIVWTYGLMNPQFVPALKAAVDTVRETDKNVWFLPTTTIHGHFGEVGANGHPGILGHRRFAKELIAFIEGIL